MAYITRHLSIYGRVQGVGYRWSLSAEAKALGLSGWVRNRSDGSVEALICGTPEAVEALTTWAYRGPPAAHVERLLSRNEPSAENHAISVSFEQRPTF
ncbi:acylphosphatase [Propionivibrio sp.]|uniref:acylphosphatase n=1 Tax=Propionivibrio sp. TaxID=2212460 RepID=UPI003BF36E4D